jgi:transposase
MISTIQTLAAQGWSERRIARELKLNRKTVRRYAKGTSPSPGSEAAEGSEIADGIGETLGADPSKYTTLSPGSAGVPGSEPEAIVNAALAAARASVSLCEPWKEMIKAALEQQLSAKRIHQDLVRDHGFVGAYQSVKRYVRRLERAAPVPYRRMEFAPGEQMQVDFGLGAWIREEGGRRRRPHVFRAVMCFSGKGYSEVVWNQKTETFLRCLENAFRYMGGVPATVAPDNLKAAVLHPDWFDPELNPKLAAFAEHYGTVILPTKPATPRHKGRVERAVDFVQENALKALCFESLGA